MAPFDFRVLGPLELRRDGELLPVPAPRQRALLGFLLLHANQPVSPDRLVEELWGEEPPASARASLRNQIHALRKLLGTETLTRGPGGYVLNVEPGELDLARFERLVAEAKRAEPRERVAKLRAALALWRGAALVEFPSEPFAQHEIARLEEERLITLEARIDAELELGEHAELVPELESLVDRYPLRERFWGQLMLALFRTGERRRGIATLEAAARMAAAVGDQRVEEWARLHLAYLSIWTGGTDATAFLEFAQHAARRFEQRGDGQGLSLALRHRYQVLPMVGRTDEAAALALRAAALAAERGDTYEEAAALMNRAGLLAEGSTPVPTAIAECERILDDGERRGIWSTPPLPLRVLLALGTLYSQAGRPDDARSVLDEAIGTARAFSLIWFLVGLERDRGWVELVAGNLKAALEHLRSAYALIETENDHAMVFGIGATLACVLGRAGQVDEAKALALQARADSTGDLFVEIVWRRALALVAAQERRADEALALADEARRRVEVTDWLTVRGETLEDAALVHRLARDERGERKHSRKHSRSTSERETCPACGESRKRVERDRRRSSSQATLAHPCSSGFCDPAARAPLRRAEVR